MSCNGCGCTIGDQEQAIEVCCDKMYCTGCAIPLTPAMKRHVDETWEPPMVYDYLPIG